MAHVLLGWELGGNRGHATALLAIADALTARGHRVSFALQRVDALPPERLAGAEVWPAPISPRLLVNIGKPRRGANSFGDIMARLGADDPDMVEGMLRAWDLLLRTIRPDAVIGEYAPFLLAAAWGRVPSIAVGTAFSTPPAHMERFPSLDGEPAAFDEAAVLAGLNRALERLGRTPIAAYPALLQADATFSGSFAELDPYAEWRVEPLASPLLAGGVPPLADPDAGELFVYAPEQVLPTASLWQGLARSGLPVRVHTANMLPDMADALAALGFAVERRPVPFSLIAERSRLVLSHGGHGFTCSALMAGLPQVICYFDLEKYLHAEAITKLGVGGKVAMAQIEADAFAASLRAVYENDDLAARARAAAPAFRTRYDRPKTALVADAVDAPLV
jgi:UDP:flavonoid glycosyltransferase YjiC (YdhE family)